MFDVGIEHYLVVSAFVFCCGVVTMAIKRNAIGILIGAELILNAANLNFLAFARYRVGGIDGPIAALFIIVLAAAEAAIALAIFLNLYAQYATIDVDQADTTKG